jgi:hypothetical protein
VWSAAQNPGGFVALKVGDATGVASVEAATPAVAVAPVLKFVGSSDIAGRTGWVYTPLVDESPEPPPATSCDLAAEFRRHTPIAATMEAPPTTLANDLIRLTSISVLLLGQPGRPDDRRPAHETAVSHRRRCRSIR